MKSKLLKKIKWAFNSPLSRIILGFVTCMIFMLAFKEFLRLFEDNGDTRPWQFLLRAAVNIGIYWLIFRFWEKRKITEISLKNFHLNGVLGLLFGISIISVVVLILLISGNYSILSINKEHMLMYLFIELFAASIFEEVLFRGIIYRIMEKSLNTIWAIIISSLLFSIIHIANSGFDITSFISLMLGGAILGITYTLTKNLWSVIFIHLGWNFAQGFFGLSISGKYFTSFFKAEVTGQTWLTGGAFGLENSYITIALLALVFTYLYRKYRLN